MRIGTHDVRLVDEALGHVPLEARQADDQLDVQTQAPAVAARADADLRRHPAVLGDLHLLLSGGELDGAEAAGGVAGRKELLGIVALRSEERRVGKEWVRPGRPWWRPAAYKKTK